MSVKTESPTPLGAWRVAGRRDPTDFDIAQLLSVVATIQIKSAPLDTLHLIRLAESIDVAGGTYYNRNQFA